MIIGSFTLIFLLWFSKKQVHLLEEQKKALANKVAILEVQVEESQGKGKTEKQRVNVSS